MNERLLDLAVRRHGWEIAKLTAEADPDDPAQLRQLLVDAVERDGGNEFVIGEYEMDVHERGDASVLMTYVTSTR